MKKIIAIVGIVILCGLYIVTLIAAIFTSPQTPQLFKACVYATVVVPVMFYAYLLMYRILKKKADDAKYETPKETDEADQEEDNDETEQE